MSLAHWGRAWTPDTKGRSYVGMRPLHRLAKHLYWAEPNRLQPSPWWGVTGMHGNKITTQIDGTMGEGCLAGTRPSQGLSTPTSLHVYG